MNYGCAWGAQVRQRCLKVRGGLLSSLETIILTCRINNLDDVSLSLSRQLLGGPPHRGNCMQTSLWCCLCKVLVLALFWNSSCFPAVVGLWGSMGCDLLSRGCHKWLNLHSDNLYAANHLHSKVELSAEHSSTESVQWWVVLRGWVLLWATIAKGYCKGQHTI